MVEVDPVQGVGLLLEGEPAERLLQNSDLEKSLIKIQVSFHEYL